MASRTVAAGSARPAPARAQGRTVRRWLRRNRNAVRLAGALAVLIIMLFPVYWMVISALKGQHDLFSTPPTFYPSHANWGRIGSAVSTYVHPLVNSVVISAIATVITALICVPGAYALAKLGVSERVTSVLMVVILVVQVLPTIMLVSPLYEIAIRLGILNQYWTVGLLDSMYSVPFGLLVLRAYMVALPSALREAALVDGCSEQKVFLRVILPNCKPGIGTVVIFAFLFAWGDFVFGLNFTNGPAVQPATVSLYEIIGRDVQPWGQLMALGTVLAVPAVVVVLIAQRALQQGVAGFGIDK
ncbi:MAG TPA: carbohydrate ABC transporter permease [Streptosporangiaceae bacterium]|jgi:multiple sugar transport system permease protein